MTFYETKNALNFFVIGLSFEKADTDIRGKYTFFPDTVDAFVSLTERKGIEHFFVLSTCNRTEFYAFGRYAHDLISTYCQHVGGDIGEFKKYCFVKSGKDAVNHLFSVSAGLESQILGDFEVVSQIKNAMTLFKKHQTINAYLERIVNTAIQISKRVRTETSLSNGAASVSYAAVNYILTTQTDLENKNILLFGTGKIGRNTCENLVKHTKNKHITLINRTEEKAKKLSEKHHVSVKQLADFYETSKATDIMIIATGAAKPTVTKNMISDQKPLLIIDLSVPENVSDEVKKMPNVHFLNVDTLSKMIDKNLEIRQKSIPDAKNIITENMAEFETWLDHRKYVPAIEAFKQRMIFLQKKEMVAMKKKNIAISDESELLSNRLIQKMTGQFAAYLLANQSQSEQTIQVISDIFLLK